MYVCLIIRHCQRKFNCNSMLNLYLKVFICLQINKSNTNINIDIFIWTPTTTLCNKVLSPAVHTINCWSLFFNLHRTTKFRVKIITKQLEHSTLTMTYQTLNVHAICSTAKQKSWNTNFALFRGISFNEFFIFFPLNVFSSFIIMIFCVFGFCKNIWMIKI